MKRLRQRVAIVTAAAQGVGALCARAMAAEGAQVAIADSCDGRLLAQEIEAEGGSAMALMLDMGDEASVQAMTRTVVEHFGRIDILVNNPVRQAIRACPPCAAARVEWERMLVQKLRAMRACARAALPFMLRQRYGRIINVCPLSAGIDGNQPHHAAILAMTQALASELDGEGIRVHALTDPVEHPGPRFAHLIAPLLALAADDCDGPPHGAGVMH
jgi:NAD(P)-dependent dehydrogenase (short-subunit alcohol dehydrogenase family)